MVEHIDVFIKEKKGALIILLALLGIGGFIIGLYISPLTESTPMLPDDHPTIVVRNLLQDKFVETDTQEEVFRVSIVWGVAGLDRSNVGLWDPEDLGEPILDEDFTVTPPEN